MLKRTLYIANPCKLSLKNNQLVADMHNGESRIAPIEDLGFVVLEHPQINISLPLMSALNENNTAVVFCDAKHMPSSMLLNLDGHHLQGELFRQQLEASEPLKKNLWKQTIEAKIRNQAGLLRKVGIDASLLDGFASKVKSGDIDNREGASARAYWPLLMGTGFIRDRYGDPPNQLLNYGYIVLRAAVARALTGSGLLATLGIHHHNRYNAFALADDIMEPYRPFVDEKVVELYQAYPDEFMLSKEMKAELLTVLSTDVQMGKKQRPLLVALSYTTASLARCFSGQSKRIVYPQW